ncbi:MAG: hypothetical protein P4M07_23450 [Xanthobacteraceae bacterium]|nr:hypothetical protein [Xanthobacteraceae bacterium]
MAIRRRRIAPAGHDEFFNNDLILLAAILSQSLRSPAKRRVSKDEARSSPASWFETRGVAALLTMREDFQDRNAAQ